MAATDDAMTARLAEVVEEVRARTGVPGLVCGVDRAGEVAVAASGTARLSSGAPMLPDTLWITGSITKIWTTSLAMIAVDNGELDLDARVIDYLPDFAVADPDVTARVTIRHLLNHSSGWDSGDLFTDDPRDRYLARLRQTRQVHPLGAASSYNNAGWVVLDAVLERVTGMDFDDQLTKRLVEPLGLARACLSGRAVLDANHAAGSTPGAADGWVGTRRLLYPQALRAAGTNLWCTAADMLTFFRMHRRDGRADDGTRVLSAESVHAMRTPTSWLYPGVDGTTALGRPRDAYCLGWKREFLADGTPAFTHAGGSIGGAALGGIVPSRDLAWIAFTNAPILEPLLRMQAYAWDEEFVVPSAAPNRAVNVGPMVGTYRRAAYEYEVRSAAAGRVEVMTRTVPEEICDLPGHAEVVLTGDVIAANALLLGGDVVEFHEPGPDGRYDALFVHRRVARRVADDRPRGDRR